MIFSLATELNRMEIKHYTKDRIPDVLRFERDLRAEESIEASIASDFGRTKRRRKGPATGWTLR